LLYEITKALAEQGLSIHLSKVATAGDMIADVFYVKRVDGAKVTDATFKVDRDGVLQVGPRRFVRLVLP
jgi:UTP:GlnB (protein PII) uridylyltransferase